MNTFNATRGVPLLTAVAAALALTASGAANAQVHDVAKVINAIYYAFMGLGVLIWVCTAMFAIYKMKWKQAKWSQVSRTVLVGAMAGGSIELAGLVLF